MRKSCLVLVASLSVALTELGAQRAYPVDLQILPITHSVRRHASSTTTSPTIATGTMKGIEGSVLATSSGIGAFGRYLSGSLAGPKQRMIAEGGFMVGDKTFRIEMGYSERLFLAADSTVAFLRGGFNTTTYLGTSGVAVRFRAAYLASLDRFKEDRKGPDGWEGETSISYTWDRVPVFAQLGYRINRMRGELVDEEMSALTLGAGLWLWSK